MNPIFRFKRGFLLAGICVAVFCFLLTVGCVISPRRTLGGGSGTPTPTPTPGPTTSPTPAPVAAGKLDNGTLHVDKVAMLKQADEKK